MKGKSRKSSGLSVRLELAFYFVLKTFAALGHVIVTIFAPTVDRYTGRTFSSAGRMIFAIVTLESPRFMLISRFHAARMNKSTKVGISAISGTAIVSIIVSTILIGSQLVAVSVDGKVIGYVENEEQYAALVQSAKTKISSQTGVEDTEIIIQETNVSLDVVMAPQQSPMTVVGEPESQLADIEAVTGGGGGGGPDNTGGAAGSGNGGGNGGGSAGNAGGVENEDSRPEAVVGEEAFVDTLIGSLLDDSAIKATLYTIAINGEEVASLATMIEASDVLKAIAEYYMPTIGEYTGRFLDDVVINGITTEIDGARAQSRDAVIDYLLHGKVQEISYTANEEDSIENIMNVLGVDEQTLRGAYPGYDFGAIAAGDVFLATINVPFIRYITEGTEITYEPIEFVVIEQNTDELYLGQREIVEYGELGELKLTHALVRINGEVVSTEIVNQEVTLEPKPESVLTGTKLVERSANPYVGPSERWGGGGDGPLGRPLDSWFLSRSVFPGHNGADMIAPRGTPIYAAAYGTVTFAGWYGGYGNLVIMNHGNGLVTYYAHCDTFNSRPGEVVERGQQIATVGTTGNSTAYHLHFEVRVGGSVQEPMNWIG